MRKALCIASAKRRKEYEGGDRKGGKGEKGKRENRRKKRIGER